MRELVAVVAVMFFIVGAAPSRLPVKVGKMTEAVNEKKEAVKGKQEAAKAKAEEMKGEVKAGA